MERPDASVIIPSLNEGLQLYLTVRSVLQTADAPCEVIVVDDGSTDGSADFVLQHAEPHVRLVRTPGVGPSQARNLGAAQARGRVLVFLDGHCFPSRDWLGPLTRAVDRAPRDLFTGCIGSAGSPGSRGWGLTLTSPGFDVRWLGPVPERLAPVPLAGSACMAIDRDRYFSIGGFYPLRVIGLEDVELCMRLWALGGRVRVVPEVEVAHVFAGRWRAGLARTEHALNALTLAVLHLEGPRLERTFRWFERWPGYHTAIRDLERRGVWRERYRLARRRLRTFNDFCATYGIAW
jgi:glycosyltransferase involved in cell wall biosynthesis